VDDHSRFAIAAKVVRRATGRAVCIALVEAMTHYGIPEETLTGNVKQFTDWFGKGGEVLFDRICRENSIIHRLTRPASPTTTGKVERFHQTLRRELLDDAGVFTDIETAQTAIDALLHEYNSRRLVPAQCRRRAAAVESPSSIGAGATTRSIFAGNRR
jgi:transposase InsO family protein